MKSVYKDVADIISKYNNIVFFGGAGVSTECGIPDFRGANGIYNKKTGFNYSPETILSHSFFEEQPDIFYEFLRNNLISCNVLPNKGHKALAELEKIGKLKAVLTQNIDNLHQIAGSKNVLELHGSLSRFYCSRCHREYDDKSINDINDVPLCDCGGVIRPDVVLYEEGLDMDIVERSIDYIKNAEVLIVAGTSLSVYPAAGLINYFKGDKIIFINKDATDYDKIANIIIREPFARTMMNIMIELGIWDIKSEIVEFEVENAVSHPTFRGVKLFPILAEEKGLGIRSNFVQILPGGEISPHTHDVVEVFTILSGNPYILIGGDWMPVEEGTTIVAYPGEIHGVRNSTDKNVVLQANFNCNSL